MLQLATMPSFYDSIEFSESDTFSTNTDAGLTKCGSEPTMATTAEPVKSAVERTSELLSAWGAGRFDVNDEAVDAALAEFFADGFELDASSAAYSGVEAYKVHRGFSGLKEWFGFLGGVEYEGLELSFVAAPAPGEVWLRFSATKAVWKATGKGAPFHCLCVYTWEGDKTTKMSLAVHDPASVAAIMSEADVPIPSPVPLPAFEPHPSPQEPFAEKMALWGAGEFNKPEVRSSHIAAGCVDDLTDTALAVGPLRDVFQPHRGIDGVGAWVEHMATKWEMSNVDVAPVVGLKPGCVTLRMVFDIKHMGTRKEAKGVQVYDELAYSADGKFVSARHYWVNAPLLASIYEPL